VIYIENNCQLLEKWIWTVTTVFKMMANFSFLLISLNRYLLVGKDHAKWVEAVAKSQVKTVTCVAFISSCLLSAITYFQIDTYSLNSIYLNQTSYMAFYQDKYTYYRSYEWGSGGIGIDFSQIEELLDTFSSKLAIVLGLITVRDLLSYFLFCILNLAIDVMTVKKLKESLAEKAKLSSLNKRNEQMKAERRCVFMVVLNSLVNVLLRLPELLAIIFYIIVQTDTTYGLYVFKMLCFTYNQCQTLNDIANPFYIISLSSNLIFFYFFNNTFKVAFLQTFSVCSKKR
jgi:hypothetical protein